MNAKEAFHFSKLALFQVRLLNDLEHMRGNNKALQKAIERCAEGNNLTLPVPLFNQSTFLSFAYIALVWLREHAARMEDQDFADRVAERYQFDDLEAVGERDVQTPEQYLRLVRNAISHGRVDVDDNHFILSDINPRRENAPTSVKLTWEQLGKLSEAALFATNDFIYPEQA